MLDFNNLASRLPKILWLAAVLIALPAALFSQSVQVELGDHGGTATLVRTDQGTYLHDGETIVDGSAIVADNGNVYLLSLSGGQWSARYLPTFVRVELGRSGNAITLTRLEDGEYWWFGPVESGVTVTDSDGSVYRLSFDDGVWTAPFVPALVVVALGQSGESIELSRLATGGVSYQGKTVGEGFEVKDSFGSVYVLRQRSGAWIAVQLSDPQRPPMPGTPSPGPVVTSDSLDAHVGVEATLKTGEDGTRGAVLVVGDVEYDLQDLSFSGAVSSAPTFVGSAANSIGRVLSQVSLLESAFEGDADGLKDALEDRWTLAAEALEPLFGASEARDVLGDLPELSSGAVDVDEAVELLEDIVAALSSYEDFHFAVFDGVFEDALDTETTLEVYEAPSSVTEMRFGTTSNTRFGSYLRLGRDSGDDWKDDLELLAGEEGIGAFAYSPLAASERADLPSRGQATYVGETVAIMPGDLPTGYTGIIEVVVQFSTSRVSSIVRDIQDDQGNPWRFDFADIDAIVLPDAYIDEASGTFETSPGVAVLGYRDSTGTERQLVAEAGIEGTFVGEGVQAGDALIGIWSVSDDSEDRLLLNGAFGAELQSLGMTALPAISDDGTKSLTFLGAEPNAQGRIGLGGKDGSGSHIDFDAGILFSEEFAVADGDPLMSIVTSEVQTQRERLDAWIRVSDAKDGVDDRREDIWQETNDTLYETVFGGESSARNLLGESYPERSSEADDSDAQEILAAVVSALGDSESFREALEDGGIFEGAADADAAEFAFAVLDHSMRVEYRHTAYGRFGVWAKQVGKSVVDGSVLDPDNPPDAFAYSPLAQTIYPTGATAHPTSGKAHYEGSTLAVNAGGSGLEFFQGWVGLTVEWADRLTNASVETVIDGLHSIDTGELFQIGGSPVQTIWFSGGIDLSQDSDGRIWFETDRPTVNVRYQQLGVTQTTWSGSAAQDGKFVGRTLDGPVGVIGTWSLHSSRHSVDMKGSFAADFQP